MSEKKKYKILLLISSAVILGVVLSFVVAGYLMSHRFSVNEKNAMGRLKELCALEIGYESDYGTYTNDKTELLKGPWDEPFPSHLFDQDVCYGYHFAMQVGEPYLEGRSFSWSATAWPVEYASTGFYSFWIDEKGIVRGSDIGGVKGDESLPIVDTSEVYFR